MGHQNFKVVKKINPTEQEVLDYMALKGFEENAKKAFGMWQSKMKVFWGNIELRTGQVMTHLRYNDKDGFIEVLQHEQGAPASLGDGFPD